MQIIDWDHFIKNGINIKEKASMTIGIFDGVHRGHQALIERVVSHNKDFIPAVVTFRENHKTGSRDDIQSFQERLAAFEKFGVQIVIVIDFTDEFKKMPGKDFLETLLKHGNTGFFAVGTNFRCGCNLDTDAEKIKNFFTSQKISAEIVPEVLESGLPISSSRIRAAIAAGDMELAERMLGRG